MELVSENNELFHCHNCGRFHQEHIDDRLEGNFFHQFQVDFGYGSLYDNEKMVFHLCEVCLFEIVKSFKHTPMFVSHTPFGEREATPVRFDYNYYLNERSSNIYLKRDYDRIEALPKK